MKPTQLLHYKIAQILIVLRSIKWQTWICICNSFYYILVIFICRHLFSFHVYKAWSSNFASIFFKYWGQCLNLVERRNNWHQMFLCVCFFKTISIFVLLKKNQKKKKLIFVWNGRIRIFFVTPKTHHFHYFVFLIKAIFVSFFSY